MTVKVKICGLTDAASVDVAVAAGADAVGFVFYAPSPRHLDIEAALELAARVPEGITRVAVMLHPDAAYCAKILAALKPDAVQTDIEDFDYLEVPDSMLRWPVIRENKIDCVDRLPQHFVYEGLTSGKGQAVDWTKAADVATRGRMILAGGLNVGNVTAAVRQVRPWAVDVSSGVEISPGRKDATLVHQFIAAAKAA